MILFTAQLPRSFSPSRRSRRSVVAAVDAIALAPVKEFIISGLRCASRGDDGVDETGTGRALPRLMHFLRSRLVGTPTTGACHHRLIKLESRRILYPVNSVSFGLATFIVLTGSRDAESRRCFGVATMLIDEAEPPGAIAPPALMSAQYCYRRLPSLGPLFRGGRHIFYLLAPIEGASWRC